MQFDTGAARGVALTEGTGDNFSQADSANSVYNTSSVEKSAGGAAGPSIAQPFDPVMMPYVSTLPS